MFDAENKIQNREKRTLISIHYLLFSAGFRILPTKSLPPKWPIFQNSGDFDANLKSQPTPHTQKSTAIHDKVESPQDNPRGTGSGSRPRSPRLTKISDPVAFPQSHICFSDQTRYYSRFKICNQIGDCSPDSLIFFLLFLADTRFLYASQAKNKTKQ